MQQILYQRKYIGLYLAINWSPRQLANTINHPIKQICILQRLIWNLNPTFFLICQGSRHHHFCRNLSPAVFKKIMWKLNLTFFWFSVKIYSTTFVEVFIFLKFSGKICCIISLLSTFESVLCIFGCLSYMINDILALLKCCMSFKTLDVIMAC